MIFLSTDLIPAERKPPRSNFHARLNKYYISQQKLKADLQNLKCGSEDFARKKLDVKYNENILLETTNLTHERSEITKKRENMLLLNRKWISKIEKFVFFFNKNLEKNELPPLNFPRSKTLMNDIISNIDTNDDFLSNSNRASFANLIKGELHKLKFNYSKDEDNLFITDPYRISKFELNNTKLKKSKNHFPSSKEYNSYTTYKDFKKVQIDYDPKSKVKKSLERKKIDASAKRFSMKDVINIKLKNKVNA